MIFLDIKFYAFDSNVYDKKIRAVPENYEEFWNPSIFLLYKQDLFLQERYATLTIVQIRECQHGRHALH